MGFLHKVIEHVSYAVTHEGNISSTPSYIFPAEYEKQQNGWSAIANRSIRTMQMLLLLLSASLDRTS